MHSCGRWTWIVGKSGFYSFRMLKFWWYLKGGYHDLIYVFNNKVYLLDGEWMWGGTVKGKIITKEEIRRNKILLIFQQLENEFELLYEMHG